MDSVLTLHNISILPTTTYLPTVPTLHYRTYNIFFSEIMTVAKNNANSIYLHHCPTQPNDTSYSTPVSSHPFVSFTLSHQE
jgi:hypothetical protein